MISGSQHWWNKADQCITVWRDYDAGTSDVEIHVQKVRFKHHGKIGKATLEYDRVTGRYHEPLRDAEGRVYTYSFGGTR
jgi:twinkle protein